MLLTHTEEMMNPFDMQRILDANNVHYAIDAIYDEVYDRWIESGLSSLTEGELTVLAINSYFGEVLNGGFYQYFSNESGRLAHFTVMALTRINLGKYADVLSEFLALFPNGNVPENPDERQGALDAIAEQHEEEFFEHIEKPFWNLYNRDRNEFRQKLFDYISQNRNEFGL